LGVIRKGRQDLFKLVKSMEKMDFNFLNKNRKELLNLISWDEFKEIKL